MGRRALRKIDKAIDLTAYLKTIEQLVPWSPESLFGRTAPLEIEVGSGKGLFLQNAARHHPEHDFLGIEIARKYAEYSAYRLARHNLPNAVMMAGDAQPLFHEHLPDSSVFAVHVYFPDPWWKKRHRKRRIMSKEFLDQVVRVLEPNGTLHFWTDVKEYFDESLELISAEIPLLGPFPVPETPAEHDLDYRTHFERRMRLRGEPVYRCEFCKAGC